MRKARTSATGMCLEFSSSQASKASYHYLFFLHFHCCGRLFFPQQHHRLILGVLFIFLLGESRTKSSIKTSDLYTALLSYLNKITVLWGFIFTYAKEKTFFHSKDLFIWWTIILFHINHIISTFKSTALALHSSPDLDTLILLAGFYFFFLKLASAIHPTI